MYCFFALVLTRPGGLLLFVSLGRPVPGLLCSCPRLLVRSRNLSLSRHTLHLLAGLLASLLATYCPKFATVTQCLCFFLLLCSVCLLPAHSRTSMIPICLIFDSLLSCSVYAHIGFCPAVLAGLHCSWLCYCCHLTVSGGFVRASYFVVWYPTFSLHPPTLCTA